MRKIFANRLLVLCLILVNTAARAEPQSYVLQPETSSVGFETDFGQDKITGRMPVSQADLSLDFQNVAASTVAVTLDVTGAEASFPFAAQAMKGPKVLDSQGFPTISFTSTAVAKDGDGARVRGNITIRGVSQPTELHAEIYRQKGSEAGDLSHLVIRLTGAVQRSDFGATGWNDMVGDQVRLDILARIQRVE